MTAQTNWISRQKQNIKEAEEYARRQKELAKYQSVLQWAHQGNDAALAGNILGQLINGGWNHMKKDYYSALGADPNKQSEMIANNPYAKIRNYADKLVSGLFSPKKGQSEQADYIAVNDLDWLSYVTPDDERKINYGEWIGKVRRP